MINYSELGKVMQINLLPRETLPAAFSGRYAPSLRDTHLLDLTLGGNNPGVVIVSSPTIATALPAVTDNTSGLFDYSRFTTLSYQVAEL
eukprot:IDg19618t1